MYHQLTFVKGCGRTSWNVKKTKLSKKEWALITKFLCRWQWQTARQPWWQRSSACRWQRWRNARRPRRMSPRRWWWRRWMSAWRPRRPRSGGELGGSGGGGGVPGGRGGGGSGGSRGRGGPGGNHNVSMPIRSFCETVYEEIQRLKAWYKFHR